MSYRDLIDISVSLDTSALQERLDEIASNDGLDEDRVQEIVRDMMHSEGEDFVQGVIDGGSYVSEYDVDDKIRDADFAAQDDFDALSERVDALEGADNADIRDLERRMDLYAGRVDDLRKGEYMVGEASLAEVLQRQTERIAELEAKIAAMSDMQDALREDVRPVVNVFNLIGKVITHLISPR